MSSSNHPRLVRERNTLSAMIRLYCREQHHTAVLCEECQSLLDYALARLDRCPFQEKKSTCAKCPVHCYKPEKRARVRQVMRYAGPRLLLKHPYLAITHLIDGQRPVPQLPSKKNNPET